MKGGLALTLEKTRDSERQDALRSLLIRPLIVASRDRDIFSSIVRHRRWLITWFSEFAGWRLYIDTAAGFARLHKITEKKRRDSGLTNRANRPFNRRRYTLLCLTLSALDDTAIQTTLAQLAELAKELSRENPKIQPFDPNLYGERRAFVDVLRWLVDIGVLRIREDDSSRYIQKGTGDALYNVATNVLTQLLSSPVPPAMVERPELIERELYPDTPEGRKKKAKHALFRRLLEDPVVYYDDLDTATMDWLQHSRGFVYQTLESHAGLHVERKKEGLAAVDPRGEVSDTLFPHGGSTVKHASLLMAAALTERVRSPSSLPDGGDTSNAHSSPPANEIRPLGYEEIVNITAVLLDEYGEPCAWKKQYVEDENGPKKLARDIVRFLESFGLIKITSRGYVPLPAIARFAPAYPKSLTSKD